MEEEKKKLKKRRKAFQIKERKKFEDDPTANLKKKIHDLRVNNLVNNFVKKISRNNAEGEPVDFSPFEDKDDSRESCNGLKMPNLLNSICCVISMINIMMILAIATMSIVFEKTMNCQEVKGIQIWGTLWLVVEIGINFVKVSYGTGYKKL